MTARTDFVAWARPGLRDSVVRVRHDGRHEAVLRVENVHSPHQVLRLEGQLQALAGLHGFDLDRAAQRLRVRWDAGCTALPELLAACAAAGCAARPLARRALDGGRRREANVALTRLLVAGLFAMQAMMFAFVLYLGQWDAITPITRELFRWLSLMAATPVVIWAAQPFYRQAVADCRRGRLGTETLITVAVLLICSGSLVAVLRGTGEVYFESISMLIFVLLAGRWLEMRARHRNGALGEAVADAVPVAAERRRADGRLELVAVSELAAGDQVHVAEGAVVPADGRVLGTRTVRVDEALLTGEATPRQRRVGQRVVAGSVALGGPLEMRVEKAASDSTLAALEGLARRVGQGVADAAGDALAGRFALRVLVLTALTALTWLWLDPTRAFEAAVAVLVVACPCAFALAAPVVSSRVLGVLGRHGVWVARPAALAALTRIDHAIFDKTGTLTAPQLQKDQIRTLRGDDAEAMLRLAAALACGSRHPLARLLVDAAAGASLAPAQNVTVVAGGGIRGRVGGRDLRLGHAGFVADAEVPASCRNEALLLADAAGVLAVFPVRERLRPEARATLVTLAGGGVGLEILSGDGPSRVRVAADALAIASWHARQSPAQKLAHLRTRRAAGATVLAVGDGSNDAPLLAAADVSAALIEGTGLAQAHADLLLAEGLDGLLLARRLARRAQHILVQNRRGALIYNLCAVPFAAAGLVSPWLAALGMSLSSAAVVLNALRIREPAQVPAPAARHASVRPA